MRKFEIMLPPRDMMSFKNRKAEANFFENLRGLTSLSKTEFVDYHTNFLSKLAYYFFTQFTSPRRLKKSCR